MFKGAKGFWLTLLVVTIGGCGGGGSSAGGDGSGNGEKNQEFGPISVTVAGVTKLPVVIGSRNAVFTGVFGAAFTRVQARMPPANTLTEAEVLSQTSIVVDHLGQPMLYELGPRRLSQIGTEQYYINSSDPSISGLGDRIATTHYTPDGTWQIYVQNLDGTVKKKVTSSTTSARSPAFSENGQTIVYHRADPANGYRNRIYSVSVNGGAPKVLTPAEDDSTSPAWAPNGQIAFYRQIGASGAYYPTLMNADGTSPSPIPGSVESHSPFGSICFLPGTGTQEGVQAVYYGSNYILWRFSTITGGYSMETSADPILSISSAPIGSSIAFYRGGANPGVYIKNLTTSEEQRVLDELNYTDPFWGPYMATRNLVGTGGPFGTAAGGFLFGQVGDRVQSFVSFDATTRSTITVTPQENPNPNQANAVCTVAADKVTSLKYLNDLRGGVTVVADTASPISGAVISFNSDTGRVSSVVPFVGPAASRSGKSLTFTGRFTGAWDAKGNDRAPGGASEVTLDATTGEIVSVK